MRRPRTACALSDAEIEQSIKAMIAEQIRRPGTAIGDDDDLLALGAESLDRLEMLMWCEQDFGIEIPETDRQTLNTVGQLVSYVCRRVREVSAAAPPASRTP